MPEQPETSPEGAGFIYEATMILCPLDRPYYRTFFELKAEIREPYRILPLLKGEAREFIAFAEREGLPEGYLVVLCADKTDALLIQDFALAGRGHA